MDSPSDRDIVVRLQDNSFRRVSALHPSYWTLAYPILFPSGNDGLQLGIRRCDPRDMGPADGGDGDDNEDENGTKYVAMMQYYGYRLHYRLDDSSRYILRSRRYFDSWLSTCMLRWK